MTTLFGIDSSRDVLVMQGGPDGAPSPTGAAPTTVPVPTSAGMFVVVAPVAYWVGRRMRGATRVEV